MAVSAKVWDGNRGETLWRSSWGQEGMGQYDVQAKELADYLRMHLHVDQAVIEDLLDRLNARFRTSSGEHVVGPGAEFGYTLGGGLVASITDDPRPAR